MQTERCGENWREEWREEWRGAANAAQDALLHRAVQCMEGSQWEEAFDVWQQALDVAPSCNAAVAVRDANMAGVALLLGLGDTAAQILGHALSLDPSSAEAICQQGRYYELVVRNYSAADLNYQRAARLAPLAALPLHAQATLRHARTHDAPGARALYSLAMELEPTNSYVVLDAARLELVAGNKGEATELAQRALQLNPLSTDAHLLLAHALVSSPLSCSAGTHARIGPRTRPSRRLLQGNDQGSEAQDAKDRDIALQLARRGLELAPEDARIVSGMGHVLVSCGLDRAAEKYYEESVSLAPGYASISRSLLFLY